ncbi:MFS transporter [Nonomuraea cavernae]|uniref:MFS transporter n=1 Tax=Nonomuraea cavernae TaxID=2045107 RepID=A0A917Z799_9ACTN|nr:MFS transporter [Nonomuraea cavernae]MCA2187005.1 MFS transporter [Nonomuraea cavernae]GGO75043.1 MFS transporter [Nonomuraea cavernae]
MTSTPTKAAISPDDRIRAVQRRTLGVLSGAQIAGGVGVAVGLALSSVVVDELSGSTVISGFAGTATVLGAALLALPTAKAAGRGGRRAGLALAYLAALAGCALSVAAISMGNWPLLLAGLVLVGGGSAGNLAARYSATDLSPKGHSARHLSLVVWAATIGSVAGPNLARPADQIGMDAGLAEKAGPFAFAALAFAAALLIIVIGLRPDPLKLARERDGASPADRARSGTVKDAWRTLRATPMARRALVIIAVSHTAMVSVMSMTPVKLHHDGSNLDVIGLVISLHIAGMYVMSPVVGWLADKAGRVPVLLLGMSLLLGASALAATADHRVWQVTVALVLLGLGWSCGLVAGSALLTESVPIGSRTPVQGLSDLLMNVCGATGTIVAGAIVGGLSYSVLGLVVGVMVALAGVWLAAGRRNHPTPA